jgi:hypothetical protein
MKRIKERKTTANFNCECVYLHMISKRSLSKLFTSFVNTNTNDRRRGRRKQKANNKYLRTILN